MRSKSLIVLSGILALLVWSGCTRTPQPAGSVTLNFITGELQTRAGDGVVSDGGGIAFDDDMPDLKILLTNAAGDVIARYPDPSLSPASSLVSGTATGASVRFSGIPEGEYKVYAAANTGSSLTVSGVNWTTIGTGTDLEALTFTALEGSTPPSVDNRMPLSAMGTLSVNNVGNGQASLQLIRCVAKVEVTFKNLTGAELSLTDCSVTLNNINPTSGYLFRPEGEDMTGTRRDLALATAQSLAFDSTGDGQTRTVGPALVFPSVAPADPGYYACNVSFTYGGTPMSFSNLPVHDSKSQNILSLERNQYLKIEIRISNQADISFNFEVCDWTPKTETIIFH